MSADLCRCREPSAARAATGSQWSHHDLDMENDRVASFAEVPDPIDIQFITDRSAPTSANTIAPRWLLQLPVPYFTVTGRRSRTLPLSTSNSC
jgi:hypothetical protein